MVVSEFGDIFLYFHEVVGSGVGKSKFFLNFAPSVSSVPVYIFIAFLHALFHIASIVFIIALNFAEIDGLLKLSVNPVTATNKSVIDEIITCPCDLSVLELSDIFAAILEKKIALAVFF